ncbi:MAG: zf-HC2 domain-containing protein [Candidatus Eremiobacterota bacterium]
MMTEACQPFRPLLEDFVDGEVEPAQLGPLQEHLRECPECFERVEFMRRMQGMLRGALSRESAPELVRRRIQKHFVVNPWQRRMSQPWVRPTLAAAVVLVVFLLGLYLLPRGERPPSAWAVGMVADHTMCWMMESGPPKDLDLAAKAKEYLGALPPLPRMPGLAQRNIKRCPVKGALASMHVFYDQGPDTHVSMYLMRQNEWARSLGRKATFEAVEKDGTVYQVATWKRDDFVTGLVAEVPPDRMERLVEQAEYPQAWRPCRCHPRLVATR